MTKQTIEVEGLPEGWKAKEVRVDPDQYNKYVGDDGFLYWEAKIKMEKIQPRRIVLEETEEETNQSQQYFDPGFTTTLKKKWREVKETDVPLNKEETKLSLSVDDAKELLNYLPNNTDFYAELVEFIKENS